MSRLEQAVGEIATHVALAADGAVIGVALAYVAARTFIKLSATSSALGKIRDAPAVHVSDLRSIFDGPDGTGEGGERLVVVRGFVESKSAVTSGWKNSFRSDALVSQHSGDRGVVIQWSQKCIYNQWRGFFGWYPDVRTIVARAWREQGTISTKTAPFVLVDSHQPLQSDYVIVDLDGSKHPLPLTTVYKQLQPIQASPYTFLQALFGHEYPIGLLDEEKILPLGKDITAVGICSSKNGVPLIKSCMDLPYFLSEMTKDQMLLELSSRTKVLLCSGIVVGSVSIAILGYAIVRNWNKWKQWRAQRRVQQQSHDDVANSIEESEVVEDEEIGDVPDGQLCVICLQRRRRSAFVPCGHLVCCQQCALSVERALSPKCPVCRQAIRNSVRIFDS